MQCKELLLELEAVETLTLSPAAVAHLDHCVHCSGLIADVQAIQSAAPALAEAEPPERIWIGLRNQLESEGLVRAPVSAGKAPAASRPASSWWGLRPAMAVGYLAALLVLAGVISMRLGPSREAPTDSTWALISMPADLKPDAGNSRHPVKERNPVVNASYNNGLEIIDNFIRMCEKTVREHPNNEVAREYLYDAYQQKAELLAMTMERGAWGD